MKIVDGPIVDDADVPFMNLNRTDMSNPFEKLSEVRIRLGVIDNPTFSRNENSIIDPLNASKVVNLTKGKFSIKWLNTEGGVIRPATYVGGKKYDVSNLKTQEEIEKYDQDFLNQLNNENQADYDDLSEREPMALTHPIMWANDSNWMGFHYLPPVGSIVIVGFRANNIPIMLGFVQPHYQVCDKLKLGEIMIKGYGNNSSHWKQNHELEHRAWIKQDDKDGKGQHSGETVYLKIKLKASSGSDDEEQDDEDDVVDRENKKGLIEIVAYNVVNGVQDDVSVVEVRPKELILRSYDQDEFLKESEIKKYSQIKMTKENILIETVNKEIESDIKQNGIFIDKEGIDLIGTVKTNGSIISSASSNSNSSSD